MKFFAATVLALSLVVGALAGAAAQAPSDGRPSIAPRSDTTGPGVERPQGSEGTDDPAALPRAPAQRTTIFGLSPTGAVLMAASLLIVVVLTVVAMTRSHDAYDFDRRE